MKIIFNCCAEFATVSSLIQSNSCASKPHGVQTLLKGWWTLGDLNPRPSGCKPDALPTELSAPVAVRANASF